MDYLDRVWSGGAGLGKTYWVFGQLMAFLLALPMAWIQPGSSASIMYATFYAGYLVFACTGIWRSASKYTGPSVFSGLAKVASVFGYAAAAALSIGVFIAITFPEPPKAVNDNPFADPNFGLQR